jgi:hypothetical protein
MSSTVLFHFRRSFNPSLSSEELMFISLVRHNGLERTIQMLAGHKWEYKRVLEALCDAYCRRFDDPASASATVIPVSNGDRGIPFSGGIKTDPLAS